MESGTGGIKPPFAGYDIVVYFGVGLFFVPFVDFYVLKPFSISYPEINDKFSEATSVEYLIAALSFAFILYVVGHAVAYLSGQFIQKPIEFVFGKTSYIITNTARLDSNERDDEIRSIIKNNISHWKANNGIAAGLFRSSFHIPILLIHIFLYRIGVFGYYHSRITSHTLDILGRNLRSWELVGEEFKTVEDRDARWFGPLKYFVMNNCPIPGAKMYNYFIIIGLLRSLAFIFLLSIWFEFYYLVHFAIDSDNVLIRGEAYSVLDAFWRVFLFVICAYISLLAFMRFQRRYVEEAFYAFALHEKSPAKEISVPGD